MNFKKWALNIFVVLISLTLQLNARDRKYSTDVVVIGAGGSGLSAAVSAAENGASVIVLEKMPIAGGSSSFAEGLFALETKQNFADAEHLSRDEAFLHSMEYNHYMADAALVKLYIDESKNTIEWLEGYGVEFDAIRMSKFDAPSWHLIKDANGLHHGAVLIDALQKRAEALGVKILFETPAKELIYENGTAKGVIAETARGQKVIVNSKAVIIATGGFGNSKEKISKWTQYDPEKVHPVIPLNKTGDGIEMALSAGADSDEFGLMLLQGVNGVQLGSDILTVTWSPLLWVNKFGKRFANEEIAYNFSFSGNAIEQQKDSYAWTVFDEETVKHLADFGALNGIGVLVPIHTKLNKLKKEMEDAVAAGKDFAAMGNTLEELAEGMGVNPETFVETITNYNEYKDKNLDEEFAVEPRYMRYVKEPPFYAVKMVPLHFVSIGGVKVNTKLETLNEEGDKIPGLYTVGMDVGGLWGDTYTLWASGSAFSFSVTSGRLAGENAAEYIK